ncbi:hypothetical protein SLS63_010252 [Diaporthe eres]|uniref:Uncharacterized protein n=1 Tax=Diaporthe eres TaxID=83184 RepID=A0ABR1NXJ5_DIAER
MLLEDPLVADDALVAVDMLVGVDGTLVSVDDMLVTVDAAVVDGIEEVGLVDEELGNAAVDGDVWRVDRLEVCDEKDDVDVWVFRLDEVNRVDEVKTVDEVKRLGEVRRLDEVKVLDRLNVFWVVDEKLRELLLLEMVKRIVEDGLELPLDWLDENVPDWVVVGVGLDDEAVPDCDELVLEGKELAPLPICADTVDDDADRVEEVVVVVVVIRVDACAAAAAAAELER